MKKLLSLTAGLLVTASLFTACPEDAPPAPVEEPAKVEPKVVIPPYAPTGEMADVKKTAAMGITKDNAEAKAIEIEATLDGMIKGLEEAKAAKAEATK